MLSAQWARPEEESLGQLARALIQGPHHSVTHHELRAGVGAAWPLYWRPRRIASAIGSFADRLHAALTDNGPALD